MAKETKQPMTPEDAEELRSDRDDALGYSREQVDSKEKENKKTVRVKKTAKKKKSR